MSKYTFTFRKGNIIVDFSTTDKTVVERQFQIWVNAAGEYAKKHPKTTKPAIQELPPVKEAPKAAEAKKEAKPEIKEEPKEEVFDKASSLLKTINNIQKADDVVVSEKEEIATPAVNFDEILEEKVENSSFEPQKTSDKIFLNLINSKNTTDKFHYLMITAYYLSEFEKLERFSLKQINAKLMQNLSEVIDHSMLQEAINQKFIELVPDLTGTSEVGEYRLTREGEEFFANKI